MNLLLKVRSAYLKPRPIAKFPVTFICCPDMYRGPTF